MSTLFGAFVLYLREGLEATLLISILFAALRQLGLMHHVRAIWIGVGLAVIGSFLGAFAFYSTLHYYDGTIFDKVFESATYLLAIVLLTGVTFWMQKHSRTMKKEIMDKASAARSGFALGLLAFTTVGREGIETAFFTLAVVLQSNGLVVLLGSVLGILAAVGLGLLVYRMGYRLDYRLFFRVMGTILILFAAGLLLNAVKVIQENGWIPFGTATLWDISHIWFLSSSSLLGMLLNALFGYSDAPTVLQGLCYLLYLLIAGGTFLWITRNPLPPRPVQSRGDAGASAVSGQGVSGI